MRSISTLSFCAQTKERFVRSAGKTSAVSTTQTAVAEKVAATSPPTAGCASRKGIEARTKLIKNSLLVDFNSLFDIILFIN